MPGTMELLVILLVGLIVLGPDKLPKIARTLGKAYMQVKRVSTDFQRTINLEIEREDLKRRQKEAEQKMFKEDPPEKTEEEVEAERVKASARAENDIPFKATEPGEAAKSASEKQAEPADAPNQEPKEEQADATEAKERPSDGEKA